MTQKDNPFKNILVEGNWEYSRLLNVKQLADSSFNNPFIKIDKTQLKKYSLND